MLPVLNMFKKKMQIKNSSSKCYQFLVLDISSRPTAKNFKESTNII